MSAGRSRSDQSQRTTHPPLQTETTRIQRHFSCVFKYKEINCIIGLVFCFFLTFLKQSLTEARICFSMEISLCSYFTDSLRRDAHWGTEKLPCESESNIRTDHKRIDSMNYTNFTPFTEQYMSTRNAVLFEKKTYKNKKKKRIRKNTSRASTFQKMLVLNQLVFKTNFLIKTYLSAKCKT